VYRCRRPRALHIRQRVFYFVHPGAPAEASRRLRRPFRTYRSSGPYFETGRYAEALEAGRKLVALRPAYVWGYGYVAMSAAALGRIDEARAAVSEARRVEPRVSLEMFQRGIGVSRPEIDARRNAARRRQAGSSEGLERAFATAARSPGADAPGVSVSAGTASRRAGL